MALASLDIGFVSNKRTKVMLDGYFGGQLSLSEGYIGKLQKKGAGRLKDFREQVNKECLSQSLLHWDDTVVFMNTKRACFRFYGNSKLALYYAHTAKDAEGLLNDGILQNLTPNTHLMHDHLKINYRKEFLFENIECIAHLQRELQNVFNASQHEWAIQMKELIGTANHDRNKLLKEGQSSFSDEYTFNFEQKLDNLLSKGMKICNDTPNRYFHSDELNVLKRIIEYRENYFSWFYDFSLPSTNNLAESSLRMIKSKMKISGQFEREDTAEDFALIRTYTETCKRNGINEYNALERLMSGNPYTLAEVLEQ